MCYVSSLVPSEGLVCVCFCSVPFVFPAFGFPVYTTCILLDVFWLPFVYIFDLFIHKKKKGPPFHEKHCTGIELGPTIHKTPLDITKGRRKQETEAET